MSKKNILKDAINDSKALKEAAMKSAEAVLMESMKENLKEFVSKKLNEEEEVVSLDVEDVLGDEDVDEKKDELEEVDMMEQENVVETEETEVEEEDEGGLSEDDLEEALMSALQEVDHGGLGEPEEVSPDKHDTGLTGEDKKEDGWEQKTAPGSKDWTVKEAAYKAKIASLVKENVVMKKALKELSETVKEVKLFNAKLLYSTKILQNENVNKNVKLNLVKAIDKASSLKEAENLYESFNTVLGLMSKGSKSVKKAPQLAEVVGSIGNSGKALTEVNSEHLGEDANAAVRRNQELAGIKVR